MAEFPCWNYCGGGEETNFSEQPRRAKNISHFSFHPSGHSPRRKLSTARSFGAVKSLSTSTS